MRICVAYDCLYPYTVGGAERWYRALAERLAARGHDVTYLTRRQWPRDVRPEIPGVRVVGVGPRMTLYASGGRRRVLPPIVFGACALLHLLVRGRRYGAVHTASFPYFSLLAAAAARPLWRYRIVVDWFEAWTPAYWSEYLGPLGGRLGAAVQALCLRVPQTAFCFSRLHEARLRALPLNGELTRLNGLYADGGEAPSPAAADSVVVFAGRLIPEKRAGSILPAVKLARGTIPGLRAVIFGEGPERDRLVGLRDEEGLKGVVDIPGFVPEKRLQAALRGALCLILPSRREGYGLVVAEAASHATPSIVVRHPDSAATELVSEGENGVVAASASPTDLADAIVRIHEAGHALRESTSAWYARNADRLSIGRSVDAVEAAYSASARARS
jgi:glycosyltransferase involved in cell wall biosynthesis